MQCFPRGDPYERGLDAQDYYVGLGVSNDLRFVPNKGSVKTWGELVR